MKRTPALAALLLAMSASAAAPPMRFNRPCATLPIPDINPAAVGRSPGANLKHRVIHLFSSSLY